MSDSYLDGKVREALLAAKGSRSLAQNTLMVWAMKDERLLRAMAQPFLKAISGAAIAGAIKRGVTVPGLGAPPPRKAPTLSREDLANVLSQLGATDNDREPAPDGRNSGSLSAADILGSPPKTATAPPTTAARRPGGGGPGKPAAPADQASTIRALAALYAKNRKRP